MHSGERWILGHRPALDGLRGIAILLVLLCHTLAVGYGGAPFVPASGAVGVAVFFTLSGFLITSLLLRELSASGQLGLTRFYVRRARRLLPALLAMISVCTVVALAFKPGFVSPGSVLSSLFYVQNWWGIAHVGARDAIGHTWSLAIEEQFYVVWPVVLAMLFRVGRTAIVSFAIVGSLGAVALRQWLWIHGDGAGGWRIYAGSDTRADGLLVGCALAVLMREVATQKNRPTSVAAGLVGLAVVTNMQQWGYQVVAPLATSLCTAAIIFGAAQGAGSRALEVSWLRWFGRRSYGLYLWHVPLMGLIVPAAWQLRVPLFLTASLTITEVSWRCIERPWLGGSIHPGGRQVSPVPRVFPNR